MKKFYTFAILAGLCIASLQAKAFSDSKRQQLEDELNSELSTVFNEIYENIHSNEIEKVQKLNIIKRNVLDTEREIMGLQAKREKIAKELPKFKKLCSKVTESCNNCLNKVCDPLLEKCARGVDIVLKDIPGVIVEDNSLLGKLKSMIKEIKDLLIEKFEEVKENSFWDDTKEVCTDIIHGIGDTTVAIGGAIGDAFDYVIDGIVDVFSRKRRNAGANICAIEKPFRRHECKNIFGYACSTICNANEVDACSKIANVRVQQYTHHQDLKHKESELKDLRKRVEDFHTDLEDFDEGFVSWFEKAQKTNKFIRVVDVIEMKEDTTIVIEFRGGVPRSRKHMIERSRAINQIKDALRKEFN